MPKIAQVRRYTVAAKGGTDYHDQEGYHWIDDHIATPMSKYRVTRTAATPVFGVEPNPECPLARSHVH